MDAQPSGRRPEVGRLAAALFMGVASLSSGFAPRAFAAPVTADTPRCRIAGRVSAAGVPLPGVALTASVPEGADVGAAATSVDGAYLLTLAAPGTYVLRANLAGFADATREIVLTADGCEGTADFELVLRSRVPQVATAPAPPPREPPTEREPGAGRRGAARGRFQDLPVSSDAAADSGHEGADLADTASQSLLPPGFSADAPTESVALAAGSQVQTVDALLFRDRLQWLEEAGGDIDVLARRIAQGDTQGQMGGGDGFGRRGGFGGDFGGFRNGPGGMRRSDRLQGSVTYDLSGSPFSAGPYSLNGQQSAKADYLQHRYGMTLGGPVKIPGVYDGSGRTSFGLTYSGSRSRSPYDAYSTVPTPAERDGDFSGTGRTIYDPLTGEPFEDDLVPADRIDPAARALLAYIPLPNQPGETQNFHYVTSSVSHSDEFTLRFTHALGNQETRRGDGQQRVPRRERSPGGGPGGRRRASVTAALSYRSSTRDDTALYPTLGGSTRTSGWDVPVSVSFSQGRLFHQLRFGYNRSRSDGSNLYAFSRDVAGSAGIDGVSRDPFDWGVPNLSFTSLADLRDRNPAFRLDQRFSASEAMNITWGRHTFRGGGDFRGQWSDSQTDSNARGSFVFTGLYTAAQAGGTPVPGTGLDFADFLLGRAQLASVQYGPGRVRFRSHSWSLFLQDDWRVRNDLTLNVGVRYEYAAPFVEAQDHLVNLDVAPGFTAAAPVLAGEMGLFSGSFPASLIDGDHDNVAPRIGVAWKPRQGLTVRGGFGINYALGAYSAVAQRLAGQPPFAVSSTGIGNQEAPLALADPFAHVAPGATTNSYGIDKHYQLPAVGIWSLDVQRQLGDFILSIGYSGTRGWDLDIQRAPNRDAAGLRIPGVAPFLWQSSEGSSILHALNLRARKRITHGIGGGVAYTFGKSIDDASSIGGGTAVVAQNDQDLAAERGLSSFDRRHRFAGDFLVELPFGPGRKWLHDGLLGNLIGGWVWSSTITVESGAPFTARVLGDFADVARGMTGTLRADVTGASVALSDPTAAHWFNTAAFVVPPAGTFGDAGRNTITGPGTFLVNMTLIKNVSLGRPRTVSLRIQANNVFNTPQFTAIDAVVNSPTFGQVVRVGAMRSVQFQTRLRF